MIYNNLDLHLQGIVMKSGKVSCPHFTKCSERVKRINQAYQFSVYFYEVQPRGPLH